MVGYCAYHLSGSTVVLDLGQRQNHAGGVAAE